MHELTTPIKISTDRHGDWYQYDFGEDIRVISFMKLDDIDRSQFLYTRVHSACCNSEVFGTIDCDCNQQLEAFMHASYKRKSGLLFYLANQEGRGHGYKIKLQILSIMEEKKINTYEACDKLGLAHDVRKYKDVITILKTINVDKIKIISNNPTKIKLLNDKKINVQVIGSNEQTYTYQNINYLKSKRDIGDHSLKIITESVLLKNFPIKKIAIGFYQKEDAYGCFSNFADYPFYLDGLVWRTSEHYYQANKFKKLSKVYLEIQQAITPIEAKNIANHEDSKHQWHPLFKENKLLFMLNALREKIKQNPYVKKQLLNTDDRYIFEDAPLDNYWGNGKLNNGKNILGRLLMYLRNEIKKEL